MLGLPIEGTGGLQVYGQGEGFLFCFLGSFSSYGIAASTPARGKSRRCSLFRSFLPLTRLFLLMSSGLPPSQQAALACLHPLVNFWAIQQTVLKTISVAQMLTIFFTSGRLSIPVVYLYGHLVPWWHQYKGDKDPSSPRTPRPLSSSCSLLFFFKHKRNLGILV